MSLGGALSLDQLVALNDELAALVRAGIPLEKGLRLLRQDGLGRGGDLAGRLSERLEAGQTLEAALEAEGSTLPPLYRAVIGAGVRSGRLATAFEGLSDFAREYAEVRGALGLALLYPLILLVCAYAFFVLFIQSFAMRFVDVAADFGQGESLPIRILAFLHATIYFWAPIVPIGLVLLGLWWVASGRSGALSTGGPGMLLGWIPGFRPMIHEAEYAGFASLLSVMISHGVPLGEALRLAGEVSGDPRLIADVERVAADLERGSREVRPADRPRDGIPSLLRWMIESGQPGGSLPEALRNVATTYRDRALRRSERLRHIFPTLLLVVIGGLAVSVYVATVLVPLSSLWQTFSRPVN